MEWLRATGPRHKPLGVDREAKVIRGMVVVQRGPIKDGRGEFDDQGLSEIVAMGNAAPKGLKSRFTHPNLSSDGLGSYLGRVRELRMDGDRVRGDLHLAETAFTSPRGNLGQYVLDLAEEDSDAISSSLVISPRRVPKLDAKGKPLVDENGEEAPPLWYPKALHASDIVEEGAAVDGLLSAGVDALGLPDAIVRQATELLDAQWPDASPAEIRTRATAYLERYLAHRFGDIEPSEVERLRVQVESLSRRIRLLEIERS